MTEACGSSPVCTPGHFSPRTHPYRHSNKQRKKKRNQRLTSRVSDMNYTINSRMVRGTSVILLKVTEIRTETRQATSHDITSIRSWIPHLSQISRLHKTTLNHRTEHLNLIGQKVLRNFFCVNITALPSVTWTTGIHSLTHSNSRCSTSPKSVRCGTVFSREMII